MKKPWKTGYVDFQCHEYCISEIHDRDPLFGLHHENNKKRCSPPLKGAEIQYKVISMAISYPMKIFMVIFYLWYR